MKAYKGITLLLLLIFSSLTVLNGQSKIPEIEKLVQQFHDYEQFSGNIIVAQHGKILFQSTLGFANREWKIPHTIEGKFLLGSLSKQFIAALSLKLSQDGVLKLDIPISNYLPNFPNQEIKDNVTLHHLLSCTSGLPHYGAWNDFLEQKDRLSYSRNALFELFKDLELEFTPGDRYRYSSLGYLLAGFVLEEATGQSLSALLQEKLFQPSGMSNSKLDDFITIEPNRVNAYRYNFNKARYDNANYRDPSTTFSAGGIMSTIEDLLKWDRILASNQLLNNTSKELLFRSIQSNYAYGWRRVLPERNDSLEVQWHAGQVTGYTSMMTRLPKDGYCIILLSNIRDMAYLDITNQIINVLYDQPVVFPKRSLLKKILGEIINGGTENSIGVYQRLKNTAINEYSFSETELLILGIELASEGMNAEAIPILELNLTEYPESRYRATNWVLLGNNHRVLGNNLKALNCYEEALALDPDNERIKGLIESVK